MSADEEQVYKLLYEASVRDRVALREALQPFRRLVETFSYTGPFTSDDGEGLRAITDEAWLNLRDTVHGHVVSACRAHLVADSERRA